MEDMGEKRLLTPNCDFETDFDVGEEDPLLGIRNDGRVNRPLATQERIGHTSFSAELKRVHYGTYESKPACLVSLEFSFRFESKSHCRYSYAEIEIEFEKAVDLRNPRVRSTSPKLDPMVVNFAPKEVYGIAKTVDEKKYWNVSVPVMFESLMGVKSSITGSAGAEINATEENRMEIHGNRSQDDDHDEGANGVTWDLTENKSNRDGIFRSFRAAIIVQHQAAGVFWMRVSVKPAVKFSLDPRRLFQKGDFLHRLFQRNDHPIFLDGKTPKGPTDLGCDDFGSKDFPWENVLQLPKEYEACANAILQLIGAYSNTPGF